MPKGFYTGYSYCGIMPDGRKAYFATDAEYLSAYEEEAKETKPSLFFAKIGSILLLLNSKSSCYAETIRKKYKPLSRRKTSKVYFIKGCRLPEKPPLFSLSMF